MATMTAVRGTPNLSVAATQNSAPVYEFRCLYSHDLRKKKKLWHDGSLRYHTFNKRVMVYDESKNYIGDSHWRDAEELQEGTELKLDRGVLVDVGDRIGETQTDLATLREKRRSDNGPSPQRPPLRPISIAVAPRNPPANPQVRPKSLSDVLGIFQGPIGRAKFPTQSPYEQLHHATVQSPCSEEPPAKKSRVWSDKENRTLPRDKIHKEQGLLKATGVAFAGRPDTSESSNLQENKRAASNRQVSEIDSEDQPIPLPANPARAALAMKRSSRKVPSIFGDHQQLPSTSTSILPPSVRTKTASTVTGTFAPLKSSTSKPPPTSIATSCHNLSTELLSSIGSSKSKLRLAVHKPRKKLLYEEILPSFGLESQLQSETPKSASRNMPIQRQDPSLARNRRFPKVNAFSKPEINGKVGIVSLGNADSSRQSLGKKQDVDRDMEELFAQSSSPLFVPQSLVTLATTASESERSDDFLSMALDTASALPPRPNSATKPPRINGRVAPGERMPAVTGILQPAPPSKLTVLDQEITIPTLELAALLPEPQQTSPQLRSPCRIVSENNSLGRARDQGSVVSIAQETKTAEAFKAAKQPTQRPYKIPTKLTKSRCNITVKSEMAKPSASRSAGKKSTEECGPWSRAEAYLLFDWFPPGREKLAFDYREQATNDVIVVKRGLLFDQVDVL